MPSSSAGVGTMTWAAGGPAAKSQLTRLHRGALSGNSFAIYSGLETGARPTYRLTISHRGRESYTDIPISWERIWTGECCELCAHVQVLRTSVLVVLFFREEAGKAQGGLVNESQIAIMEFDKQSAKMTFGVYQTSLAPALRAVLVKGQLFPEADLAAIKQTAQTLHSNTTHGSFKWSKLPPNWGVDPVWGTPPSTPAIFQGQACYYMQISPVAASRFGLPALETLVFVVGKYVTAVPRFVSPTSIAFGKLTDFYVVGRAHVPEVEIALIDLKAPALILPGSKDALGQKFVFNMDTGAQRNGPIWEPWTTIKELIPWGDLMKLDSMQ